MRGFRHERLDDAFIGHRRELTIEAPTAFGHEVDEPTAAFAQRLRTRQHVGDVVVARHRERVLRVEHLRVERAELHPNVLLLLGEIAARFDPLVFPTAQLLDVAPREMQADRVHLGDETVVAPGRVSLALERPQLAPHLAQEIGEAQQVALGGLEPALRLFLALAELQDPGRFFDDGPAIFGPRVQHRVELALPHDDVLLATDAGVGEQILDVEQPARNAVHEVFRLARAEQHPGDRDFGEFDREQARGVVDRERHLGAAERGPVGGPREDDVVHLGAAQRARTLSAQHPRDRVDDVRLPRPVRADDDAHPRLELERGLVRERLEALQRQRFEEQTGPLSESRW